MSALRTAWHVPFWALLAERSPSDVEVRAEVLLSREPQRADLILLRRDPAGAGPLRRALVERRLGAPIRPAAPHPPGVARAPRVLRGLWPLLRDETIAELKSLSRPFRRGDLIRLMGYCAQHHVLSIRWLRRRQLTSVLIVPSITRTLLAELKEMEWSMRDLGGGYRGIVGSPYTTHVVVIDEVAESERDDVLGMFGHGHLRTREARRWWRRHFTAAKEDVSMRKLDGYEAIFQKMVEELPPERRMKGLRPEQRLKGLKPEQRLAGLGPDEILLALPAEVLEGLKEDYVRSLPSDVQGAIRLRTAAGRPRGRREVGPRRAAVARRRPAR